MQSGKIFTMLITFLMFFSIFSIVSIENAKAEPEPNISDTDIPVKTTVGETVTLSITGVNQGSEAGVGYLSMSFPDNQDADSDTLWVGDTDLETYEIYQGDTLWYNYGDDKKAADYPLIEGEKVSWKNGESRTLNVKYKPESAGTYRVNIKFTMYYDNHKSMASDPTSSQADKKDEQQEEWCYEETIEVEGSGSSGGTSNDETSDYEMVGQEGAVRLSASKTVTPYSGISFTVEYTLTGEIITSKCYKGKESTWHVKLTDSKVNLHGRAYVTGIVDESFDKSMDVPLGTEIEVPVAAGGAIKVPIKITADSKNIEIKNTIASTSTNKLHFSEEGKQGFPVEVSDDASIGDEIIVDSVQIVPTIMVGLKASVDYGLGTWEKNIAKDEIGVSSMNKMLAASTEVKEKSIAAGLVDISNKPVRTLLFMIIIIVSIIGIATLVRKRRNSAPRERPEKIDEREEKSSNLGNIRSDGGIMAKDEDDYKVDIKDRPTQPPPMERPPEKPEKPPKPTEGGSPTDKIRELHKKKKRGMISEAEYEKRKEEILDEI